jgi:hypothetical protein
LLHARQRVAFRLGLEAFQTAVAAEGVALALMESVESGIGGHRHSAHWIDR